MLTVCTGWSPSGWAEYGQRFLETFCRHWPQSVKLVVYAEVPVYMPRGECRLIWEIPGCRDFIERHINNPKARGKAVKPDWKRSAIEQGYNWRFDAWKWCRQGFIPLAASESAGEYLCWLDGDVITHRDVPEGWVESLLPKGKDLAYLGRENGYHSEIGFQLYRLPQALNMLRHFRDYYADDAVFNLREWHSAYVFDQCMRETGIKAHNLTPGGSGHVWWQSPLKEYLDHLKGKRKELGRSAERVA